MNITKRVERISEESYNRINPDLIGLRICVYVIVLRFLRAGRQRDLKVEIFHRRKSIDL